MVPNKGYSISGSKSGYIDGGSRHAYIRPSRDNLCIVFDLGALHTQVPERHLPSRARLSLSLGLSLLHTKDTAGNMLTHQQLLKVGFPTHARFTPLPDSWVHAEVYRVPKPKPAVSSSIENAQTILSSKSVFRCPH